MIEIKDLRYHYQGGPEILKSISFRLEEGRFLAILGNNGAGKSTMLKCFNKIIFPDSGSVVMDGEEILYCFTSCGGFPRLLPNYRLYTRRARRTRRFSLLNC